MGQAKSFYIFDFDDNIINTGSSTYIYHKETGEELTLTSPEFAQQRTKIGVDGPYKDYLIDPSPLRSFRRFGDDPNVEALALGQIAFRRVLKRARARVAEQRRRRVAHGSVVNFQRHLAAAAGVESGCLTATVHAGRSRAHTEEEDQGSCDQRSRDSRA